MANQKKINNSKLIEYLNNYLDFIIKLSEYYNPKNFNEIKKLFSEKYIKQLTDGGVYQNKDGSLVTFSDYDDYGDKIILGITDITESDTLNEEAFPALRKIAEIENYHDLEDDNGNGFYKLFKEMYNIAIEYQEPIGTWLDEKIIATKKLKKLTIEFDYITLCIDVIGTIYKNVESLKKINFSKLSKKQKLELRNKINSAEHCFNVIVERETGYEPIVDKHKNSLFNLFDYLINKLK